MRRTTRFPSALAARVIVSRDTAVWGIKMGSQATVVLYVLLMVAVVVGVDLLFFKNHSWERLTVNIGIVLVFAAFYFRFLKRP
jgi:hypothetical protein